LQASTTIYTSVDNPYKKQANYANTRFSYITLNTLD
jgi:hypothetical protein